MEYREFIKKLDVPGHMVPERLTYEDGLRRSPRA
jgi:hypothetical protein